MKSSSIKIIYIVALLAIVGGLLFAAAAQKSFWEDESFSAIIAQKDVGELLQGVAWDVHPPLYLLLIHQWGRLFGFDEIGLRSFSIICALAALLLTYKLAYDLLGERVALIAITLMALMPLMIMYGHNARYYSLAVVLALLAAWGALRFSQPRQFLFLLLYISSGTAFLYLLFASASVLLACNLWWLARWFSRKEERSYGSLGMWLGGQAAIAALYVPGLRIFQNISGHFSQVAVVDNWLVEIVKRAGYYGFVSAVGETFSPLNPAAWLGLVIVVGVAVYALVKNYRRLNFWLPVSFFVLIAAINLLITFNSAVSATWQNLPYRALYAYPFLMIWLAAGFASLKARWAFVSGAALLVVFVLGIFNYFTNRQYLRPLFTVPWDAMFERIQSEAKPGALVLCGYGDSSCYYYTQKFGFEQNDLYNWPNLSKQEYPEVWYIQTNLGRDELYGDQPERQAAFFEQMSRRFPLTSSYNYAPQDPSIRWLKARFLNQDDYEYRVILREFFGPSS